MTFASIETSRRKGSPVNLFFVKYGESVTSYYGYTNAETTIVHDGKTYEPIPVSRGNISVTGKLDKAAIEVRMPLSVDLAEHFRVYPPSQVVQMTIRQGHLTDVDSEFLVCWAGRIISAKRTEMELVLTCEPINTSMRRVGLRRHQQYTCPHALYGDKCQANKAAATMTAVVESVSGTTVTLPVGWVDDVMTRKYLGGMVEWTNAAGDVEIRTILRINSFRNLVLSGLLRDLEAAMTVNVILGCNHSLSLNEDGSLGDQTDCHFLHDNILNFGGCPWIPKKNPVGNNVFY